MSSLTANVPWTPFRHNGETFDLSHLHPCEVVYVQSAVGETPAIRYTVDVTYSLHCFTRGLPKDGVYDRELVYSDSREERLFDHARYKLSKQLPVVIETLALRKCMHTGHGNFFTVALVSENGASVDYDVFFTATKSSKKGRINLFIQSAFVREKEKLPAGRTIRFVIILHNTLHKKPIRG